MEQRTRDVREPSQRLPLGLGTAAAQAIRSVSFRLVPLPGVLILDGRVQDDGLEQIGKSRFWLKNRLQEQRIASFRQVYYCSVNHDGKWYVNL